MMSERIVDNGGGIIMSITRENVPGQVEINAIQRMGSGHISVLWGWSFPYQRIVELCGV